MDVVTPVSLVIGAILVFYFSFKLRRLDVPEEQRTKKLWQFWIGIGCGCGMLVNAVVLMLIQKSN
jgi:hypothetical protein